MKRIILIVSLLTISISPTFAASKKKQICPSPVSMACLKKNFDALYQDDYKALFSVYHKHQNRALSCTDIKATADYLSLAPVIEMNAEVSEDFGEVLERFTIEKPTCFLDAASLLDDQSLKVLIRNYTKEPTFVDEKKIKNIFNKHKSNRRYARVMSLYFMK